MMRRYDGDAIYKEPETKIKTGETLADADMLNLIFLPLIKNNVPKGRLAVNSIKLAQGITDATKRNTLIAATFAFASKYLNEDKVNELLGVLKMTDLATVLTEDKAVETAKKYVKRQGKYRIYIKAYRA